MAVSMTVGMGMGIGMGMGMGIGAGTSAGVTIGACLNIGHSRGLNSRSGLGGLDPYVPQVFDERLLAPPRPVFHRPRRNVNV
mmetsp:Transcript_10789/g.22636  ORF Transcript_10789/g.22636 Transcript_10789/m.22636 type:complete len:82 (-) Transcript_10789:11-256(-)